MLLALDAMGGDRAPDEPCRGAIMACEEVADLEIALVGDSKKIKPILEEASSSVRSRLSVVHTDEFVTMEDSPTVSIRRKKNSSLKIALEMVKSKEAAACISAGNTGAIVAGGVLVLGRIPGIDRPGLGVPLTALNRTTLLMDVGATIRCKPVNLYQFALMGSIYMRSILGIENPSVALLSNGEEEMKGDDVIAEARDMIKASNLNFYGYVEGKDVPLGKTDVVICDGYTGNVLLKFGEGLGEVIYGVVKAELEKSIMPKIGLAFMWPMLKRLYGRFDYEKHGGTPLLGVEGGVIKAHGRSKAKAISSAISVVVKFTQCRGVQTIKEEVQGRN